jgi:hypothetical protein
MSPGRIVSVVRGACRFTAGQNPERGVTNFQLSVHFFVQVAAILATCRVVGLLVRRLGQPQVGGEMIAGVLLGPSLLG